MENKTNLSTLFTKSKYMMRMEFMSFLTFNEMPKIALLSKEINQVVDSNRSYITTSADGKELKWIDENLKDEVQLN